MIRTLKSNALELLGVDENGGKAKTEKEENRERGELIRTQKKRLAEERKFKNEKSKSR
jgi:hypothetical protein